jgi:predicted Na+-dependent transporter
MLIPLQTIGVSAAAAIFVIMLSLGLAIPPERLSYLWRRPLPLARGALSVLVLVPLLALMVVTHVDLPMPLKAGIMVMAISPGAPIALRRSLEAGAHDAFAPCLQLVVVTLAIVTIPLSIEFLDVLYFGNARADPLAIARQVFFAQLLPLALGIGLRSTRPALALRAEPSLARAGNVLFALLAVVIVVNVWNTAIEVGLIAIACALGLSVASIGIGFLLGSPDPGTRPAMAVVSALRNPGLALLLASANNAAPGVVAMILAYLLCSAAVVVAYVLWRRKVAGT